MIRALIDRLLQPRYPNARPLPPHVQAVKIDPKLLLLHMERTAHPPPPERKTSQPYS